MLTAYIQKVIERERQEIRSHRLRWYWVTASIAIVAALAPLLFWDLYIWPIVSGVNILVLLLRLALLFQEFQRTRKSRSDPTV